MILRRSLFTVVIFGWLALSAIQATARDTFKDKSRHAIGFVTVNGIKMQYLDWGGTGRPLVLLPGLGNTAHIFDELAPHFTDHFHVYAFTPRGFGASDRAQKYSVDIIASDISAAMDSLKITRAILAGHSIGGAYITQIAALHPNQVVKLIYLAGAADYSKLASVLQSSPLKRPDITAQDESSRDKLRAWMNKSMFGFWNESLEADFREPSPAPEAMEALRTDLVQHPVNYSKVKVPILSICALDVFETAFPWAGVSVDKTRRTEGEKYIKEVLVPYEQASCARLQKEATEAKTVEMQGHQYIYMTNAQAVVKEMRAFMIAG